MVWSPTEVQAGCSCILSFSSQPAPPHSQIEDVLNEQRTGNTNYSMFHSIFLLPLKIVSYNLQRKELFPFLFHCYFIVKSHSEENRKRERERKEKESKKKKKRRKTSQKHCFWEQTIKGWSWSKMVREKLGVQTCFHYRPTVWS